MRLSGRNSMQQKLLVVALVICRHSLMVATGTDDFNHLTRDVAYRPVDIRDKKMAEGCVGKTLYLLCSDVKVINISSVVLGDSDCTGSNCCIKPNDCTKSPNVSHVQSVHSMCNGHRYCSVPVFKEEIYCAGFWDWDGKSYNDFERITYSCVDSQGPMTPSHGSGSTEHKGEPSENGDADHTDPPSKANITAYALGGACLIVIIVIVVIVVVIIRRNKTWKRNKTVHGTEMSNVNAKNQVNHGNNSSPIYANDSSQANNASTSNGYYDNSADDIPGNTVYSLAGSTGNDTDLYSEAKEPEYEISKPVDAVYSQPAKNPRQVGSSGDSIYCNADGKNPKNTGRAEGSTYEAACDWKEDMYEGVDIGNQSQNRAKPGSVVYSKVTKPITESDKGQGQRVTKVSDTSTSSPIYEPMSPEGIYANEPAAPIRSMSIANTSRSGSGTESPYCDMGSPKVRLQDGEQTVMENEIYTH